MQYFAESAVKPEISPLLNTQLLRCPAIHRLDTSQNQTSAVYLAQIDPIAACVVARSIMHQTARTTLVLIVFLIAPPDLNRLVHLQSIVDYFDMTTAINLK